MRVTPENLRVLQALSTPGVSLLRRSDEINGEVFLRHALSTDNASVHPRTVALFARAGWIRETIRDTFVISQRGKVALRNEGETVTRRMQRCA